MGRPGIMVYFDIMEPLAVLSDAERGRFFTAMLDYGRSGEAPAFDGMLALAWGFVKPKIDKDAQEYERIVEKRKYAVSCRERRRKGKPEHSFDEGKEDHVISDDNTWYPTTPTAAPSPTKTNTTISTAAAAATNTPLLAEVPEGDAFAEEPPEQTDTAATTAEYIKLKYWGGKLGKQVLILSEAQFDYLLDTLGLEMFDYYLDKLSSFIVEKNAKVKNHFETILRWWKEDSKCANSS